MDTQKNIYIFVYTEIRIHVFLLCQLTRPGNDNSPVALNTPRAQSLVSKTTLIKGSRDLGEMADHRSGEGSAHKDPRASGNTRKKEMLKNKV